MLIQLFIYINTDQTHHALLTFFFWISRKVSCNVIEYRYFLIILNFFCFVSGLCLVMFRDTFCCVSGQFIICTVRDCTYLSAVSFLPFHFSPFISPLSFLPFLFSPFISPLSFLPFPFSPFLSPLSFCSSLKEQWSQNGKTRQASGWLLKGQKSIQLSL